MMSLRSAAGNLWRARRALVKATLRRQSLVPAQIQTAGSTHVWNTREADMPGIPKSS